MLILGASVLSYLNLAVAAAAAAGGQQREIQEQRGYRNDITCAHGNGELEARTAGRQRCMRYESYTLAGYATNNTTHTATACLSVCGPSGDSAESIPEAVDTADTSFVTTA